MYQQEPELCLYGETGKINSKKKLNKFVINIQATKKEPNNNRLKDMHTLQRSQETLSRDVSHHEESPWRKLISRKS
jgi:hypothetical protein